MQVLRRLEESCLLHVVCVRVRPTLNRLPGRPTQLPVCLELFENADSVSIRIVSPLTPGFRPLGHSFGDDLNKDGSRLMGTEIANMSTRYDYKSNTSTFLGNEARIHRGDRNKNMMWRMRARLYCPTVCFNIKYGMRTDSNFHFCSCRLRPHLPVPPVDVWWDWVGVVF